ncbi:MAG: metal ABC transporter ATP-binding protein [Bacteroidaceae bacterium]|nr:metal ABC transporter ATP-binding protein [Bacteroidaceae bacterium]
MSNKPLIEINNLSVNYGQTVALQNVSLTIAEHDYIGVIGPNGGGKTTLVKAILGLTEPTQGTITYRLPDGSETHDMKIGYLPQYLAFDFRFPITVREVVSAGLLGGKGLTGHLNRDERQQVSNIIKRMDLDQLAERSLAELSGGQRQHALMARALVGEPRLLILDEPTTYIDPDSQQQMYTMLRNLWDHSDCAILLVTHDVSAIRQQARRIIHVNRNLTEQPIEL